MPGAEVEELTSRARSEGGERGIRPLLVFGLCPGDDVTLRELAQLVGRQLVRLRGVETEHLGAQFPCHLRIAVFLAQLVRDLERAEGLDLVLGRAIPDGVRA